MKKDNFTSGITAKISANEAIKKISNVPEWWGITFTGNSEKQNDKLDALDSNKLVFLFNWRKGYFQASDQVRRQNKVDRMKGLTINFNNHKPK